MVKNGCDQSCDGTLKLTLSEKWTNGINWFLASWCRFITVKSWSKIYWVGMVKNKCGLSGHGTLKLTLSQNWTDEIADFLRVTTNAGRLKVDSVIFDWILTESWFSEKWQWLFSSWDPKTCVLKMNIWIEVIVLVLIMIQ